MNEKMNNSHFDIKTYHMITWGWFIQLLLVEKLF